MAYTYSDDLFSDLHKDVYGYRPRGWKLDDWNAMNADQKQEMWDTLCDQLEENSENEKKIEAMKVEEFKERIHQAQTYGAADYWDALRWITGRETFYHIQDVEHFVWEQGILFTQYGKQLIKDIAKVVEYKEYA
jgi:urocanate hydratase